MDDFCVPSEGMNFYDRDNLDVCLQAVRPHADDPLWITARLDCIHKVLRAALETDSLAQDAIDVLLKIIHALLLGDDHREGLNRTIQALLRAMELKNADLKAQLSGVLATYLSLSGNLRGGLANALTAISYIHEMKDVEAKLHACVHVMWAFSYGSYSELPSNLIDAALDLTRIAQNRQLIAEMHLLLAHFRNHQSDEVRALEHARLAIEIAEAIDDRHVLLRAHMQRAASYRIKGDFAKAEQCLIEAISLKGVVDSERRTGIVLLEQADLLFERQEFARAERLYRQARTTLEDLNLPYIAMLAKHGLGLVWIEQARFDEARAILYEVYDEYRWIKNFYGTADIRFVLACCEARAGNPKIARNLLRGAEGLARRLDPSAARDGLIEAVVAFRRRLDAGEFDVVRSGSAP